MISTKAFAELCDTTKRTVIHYDRIGLLKPASHKGKNRLYRPRQVLTFQKIALLKSFKLTLSEVGKYLYGDKRLEGLFLKQHSQLKKEKQTLEKRIAKIDGFLNNIKKGQPMVVPEIKIIKPYSFYGIKKVGRYVDIARHQRELFKQAGISLKKQSGLTVFHDSYYSPEETRMTSGSFIKDKKIKEIEGVQTIRMPGHQAVSYTHIGPYSYLSYIWQFIDKYVEKNGLKVHPEFDCREFYWIGPLSGVEEEDCITELQIPIRKP